MDSSYVLTVGINVLHVALVHHIVSLLINTCISIYCTPQQVFVICVKQKEEFSKMHPKP